MKKRKANTYTKSEKLRRFKKAIVKIALGLLVLGLTFAAIYLAYKEQHRQEGLYLCNYVFDGDTISVLIDEKETRVRLIGIDTPESVAKEDYYKENTPQGDLASEFTKGLLLNQNVYLEYDEVRYDQYGRLLAYVFLEDGRFANEIILKEGYGQLMIIEPNDRYVYRLEKAEKQARREQKGFWKDYYSD